MSKFCHNCGTQLDDGVRFCANCGSEQVDATAHEQSNDYQNQYQAPNYGYQEPNQGYQAPNYGYQAPNQGYQAPQAKPAGAPAKPQVSKRNLIISSISLVVIVVSLFVIWSFSTISLSEYKKIENGMSYSEVVDIIGCEGELTSSYGGAAVYTWKGMGFGGANAVITFYNNRVQGKAQTGLIL